MEIEERKGGEGGEDEGRKVTRSDRDRDRDGGKDGEKDEGSRGCC